MKIKKVISYFTLMLLIICTIIPTQITSYAGMTENEPVINFIIDDNLVPAHRNANANGGYYFDTIVDNNAVWSKIQIIKDDATTIELDGDPVYSSAYSSAYTLSYGVKLYHVNVDGTDYNSCVYKMHPDEHYDLKNIKLGNDWNFEFNPNIYEYNLTATTSSIIVPVVTTYKPDKDLKRSITINGNTFDKENSYDTDMNIEHSFNPSLNVGLNTIIITDKIKVGSQPLQEKTYTFNLTKIEPVNTNTGGSSSGGGGSSSTSTASSTVILNTTVDSVANAVVVSVSQTQLTSLFNLLKDTTDTAKLAVIQIPKKDNLNNYKIALPTSVFTGTNSTGITLETGVGSLTMMDSMLQSTLTNSASNVELNIGSVDASTLSEEVKTIIGNKPVISLNMAVDGTRTEWNNPDSPVIVSIPYTPTTEELANPEKIVVYYIDGQGNLNVVSNSKYDSITKSVVFSTTHFSNYAIGYNNKTFTDIIDTTVKNAVETLASKGIVSGKTETEFKPNDTITRAEFITLLSRAFSLNTTFTNNFTDVSSDKYYYNPIGVAKELDIINGINEFQFSPNGLITKTQIEIVMNNLAKVKGLNNEKANTALNNVSDTNGITRDEVCVMIYELIK